MGVPERIPIGHDDYHARHVGRLADGRQFFVTQPFVAATGGSEGCEFLAVYLFDSEGRFLEARIDSFGPRASMDREAAVSLLDQRLAELGDASFESIAVAPFRVERDGVTFGLLPRPPEDEDDSWWVILEPGNYMAFTDPWDGLYDT